MTPSFRLSYPLIYSTNILLNQFSYQLAVINPEIDEQCSNLLPGQVLCLGTEGEDCKTTHVVEANDSCDGLYSTYGINSTVLFHNNPQLDAACNNLYIGEVRPCLTAQRAVSRVMID